MAVLNKPKAKLINARANKTMVQYAIRFDSVVFI